MLLYKWLLADERDMLLQALYRSLTPFDPLAGVGAGALSTFGMKSRAMRQAKTVITILGFTSVMSSGSA